MGDLAGSKNFAQRRKRELQSHFSSKNMRERFERISSIRTITKELGNIVDIDKIKDSTLYNLYIKSVNDYVNSPKFYKKVFTQFREDIGWIRGGGQKNILFNTVHKDLAGLLYVCREIKREIEVDVDIARGGFYYVGVDERTHFYMLRDDDTEVIKKFFISNIIRYGEKDSVLELNNFIREVLRRDTDDEGARFVRGYPERFDVETNSVVFKFKDSNGNFINEFEFLLRENSIKNEDNCDFKGCYLLMMKSVYSKDSKLWRILVTRKGAGFRSFEVYLRCKSILKTMLENYEARLKEYVEQGDKRAVITQDRLRAVKEMYGNLTLRSIFLRKKKDESGVINHTFVISICENRGRFHREAIAFMLKQLKERFFKNDNYNFAI